MSKAADARLIKNSLNLFRLAICLLASVTLVSSLLAGNILVANAEDNQTTPRVNVPYWRAGTPYPSHAVFWFGTVDYSHNYADVRLIYGDTELEVVVHVIDRLLQYDTSPSKSDLISWDAVTLYIDTAGNSSKSPGPSAYRFDAQLNWWEPREDWQNGYRGDGSAWVDSPIPFTTEAGWRGEGLNDNGDDKGWNIKFNIPFTSLGFSGAPSHGTIWGLAVAMHDRDSVSSAALPDTIWPRQMNTNIPATWGQIHFSVPVYIRPNALPVGNIIIRNATNGVSVMDGHVGGHTTCGDGLDHWGEWGEANYAGFEQINIQNQWDVSDYPCFSKFYVTFPSSNIPAGKVILSATLTMHLFGNSGGGSWGEPPESYIQVFSINEAWDENSLTWNNAPLAKENIAGTWVEPLETALEWPGIPYVWDVSRAVAEAYLSGTPVHLALYSADGERHTGKYFSSSDTGDWNAVARPTLNVVWGDLCTTNTTCTFTYLPLAVR